MFGSFQLCAEVWIKNPNFIWLISTLEGSLIYDFCFYYSYRILFGSLELCSHCGFFEYVRQVSWGLARRNSRAVLGWVYFPMLSIIYSFYYQYLCAVQIKRGGRGGVNHFRIGQACKWYNRFDWTKFNSIQFRLFTLKFIEYSHI